MRRNSLLLVVLAAGALFALLAGAPTRAWAVPSFARQTGLPCSRCHITFPELTEFGREFKLNGYTLSGKDTKKIYQEGKGNQSGIWINQNLPISVMFQLADTFMNKIAPGTQNGNVEFPQQLSIFMAGEIATHLGTFMQVTYSADSDHLSLDNTDVRYTNFATFAGKQLVYGLDMNNNPTVEDLWNDTPAWGWPWAAPDSAATPAAAPLIAGGLAQDVGGLGAYAMWGHHWYGDFTLYRSMHLGGPQPPNGAGFGINISGAAPYWRGAYQTNWGNGQNYIEIGTYGMWVNSFPNAVAGAVDHYTDNAVDLQYDRHLGADELTSHFTFIDERSDLAAALAAGLVAQAPHSLKSVSGNAIYHFGNRFSLGAGPFATWGTSDAVLYAPAPVAGSATGSPNSSGYLVQAGFWPAQNVELSVSYQGYLKFNGASANYDGAGRNASQNNTVYLNCWLMF